MRSELESRRKLAANFGPARCGISSVGRIQFGLSVTSRKSIYAKDSTVILIGFVHKAMCAITSAKLLKICATKASFIASGYHELPSNSPVGTEKAGSSRLRPGPLRQESADRKISAA